MPMTEIHLHQGTTTPEKRKQISDAIHAAMQEVLGIPADDRIHTFTEYPEGSFFHEDVIFGIPRDKNTLLISFSFNERTAEQKQRLFTATAEHLERTADVTPDQVMMRVIETARENWWATGRVVNPTTGYDERMSV